MNIAVIGGGAAGFFAAISCKLNYPQANVTIFEKSTKVLAKVKISGGGRCNVTHQFQSNSQFAKNYPRGEKFLKKSFEIFNASDTVKWFEERGVKLKTEEDGRMFPVTDNSQTIIDCFHREVHRLGIQIQMQHSVKSITKENAVFCLSFAEIPSLFFDAVIVSCGGSPNLSSYEYLKNIGHTIVPPLPSLFTFNMPNEPITALMGITVQKVLVKIQSTQLWQQSSLLITHWGMSGPAILKLSAWGSRILSDLNYDFKIQVNWVGIENENIAREQLNDFIHQFSRRKISNQNPFQLAGRLWLFLLQKINLNPDTIWIDLSKNSINKLINVLLNDIYSVKGKTTFKEEFVTCGGIDLAEINPLTMESKICSKLYFAGEVLDIDGITGGFNFQAAWTSGYIAAKLGS